MTGQASRGNKRAQKLAPAERAPSRERSGGRPLVGGCDAYTSSPRGGRSSRQTVAARIGAVAVTVVLSLTTCLASAFGSGNAALTPVSPVASQPEPILATSHLLVGAAPSAPARASTRRAVRAVAELGSWVDVDESGIATSGAGGSGYISATGVGNQNYGFAEECEQTSNGGPFAPAWNRCPEIGRSYASPPNGFWFTGNEHCVHNGAGLSGSAFTWHVQLPQTGHWHVEAYIPAWTSYGWGNHYVLTSAEGQTETSLIQQAYHGQWVSLFGSHQYTAGQDYTVTLGLADTSDAYCHYQMADQMKWVYDGQPKEEEPKPEPKIRREVVQPTISTTTHEQNRQAKTEPPTCTTALGSAPPPPPSGGHRKSKRATRGARKLLHAKAVRITLAIQLCGASAREAGVAPGTTLTGTGVLDASRARASWTINLPESLGGHAMYVISHGKETFVRAASIALSARKPWVRVRGREFSRITRLGFLGKLAIDTNPAAAIGFAATTEADSTARLARRPVGASGRARGGAVTASSACDVTGGAALTGPLDATGYKQVIGRFKAGAAAAKTIASAGRGVSSVVLNRGGTLAGETFALEADGLTVSDDLCPEAKHDSGTDPLATAIPSIGSVLVIDPCLVGDWVLHQVYADNPWGPGTGSVTLAIGPTGVSSLDYLISEPSAPPLPPETYEWPGYSAEITHSVVGAPIVTLSGVASGEVLAPVSTNTPSAHRLVWEIAASTVTSHIPGYMDTETGEETHYEFVPPDEALTLVQPFDRVRETNPWDWLEAQEANSTKYECDEKQGVATLKLELPFERREEEFWRPART